MFECVSEMFVVFVEVLPLCSNDVEEELLPEELDSGDNAVAYVFYSLRI